MWLVFTVRLSFSNLLTIQDPEGILALQDLMVFQVKWVHLVHPPWIMASW